MLVITANIFRPDVQHNTFMNMNFFNVSNLSISFNIVISKKATFLITVINKKISIDPSCQKINTDFRCYVSDPFCLNKTRQTHSNEMERHYTDISSLSIHVVSITAGCIVPIVGIGIIVCYIRRRYARNKSKYTILKKDKNNQKFIVYFNFTN